MLAVGDIHLENFGTWTVSAAIHLGARDRRDALRKDLEKRKQRWFRTHIETAAEFVTREYAEWEKSAK